MAVEYKDYYEILGVPRGADQDDTFNIQRAVDGCPAGQVVQLAAGTFTVAVFSPIVTSVAFNNCCGLSSTNILADVGSAPETTNTILT